MSAIFCGIAAVAVACIYYSWRAYADDLMRRERLLRGRVAFMLWVMAKKA